MKTFIKVIKGVSLSLISFLLFAVIISFFTIITIKKVVTEENITNLIENVDIKELVYNEDDDTIGLIDEIYMIAEISGIPSIIVDKSFETEEIKSILKGYIVDGKESILKDEQIKLDFSIENIVDIVNEAIDNANEEGLTKITEKQKKQMLNNVRKQEGLFTNLVSEGELVLEDIDEETLSVIKSAFDTSYISYLIVSIIILIIALAVIVSSKYKWMIWSGVSFIVSSLFIFITAIVLKSPIDLGGIESLEKATEEILSVAGNSLIIYSLIPFVLGVIQVCAYKILRKKELSNKEK